MWETHSSPQKRVLQEDQKDGIAGAAQANGCAHKGPGSHGGDASIVDEDSTHAAL